MAAENNASEKVRVTVCCEMRGERNGVLCFVFCMLLYFFAIEKSRS